MPKRRSKASTVAGAIGAPPLTIVRSDEVSRSRASGASMSAMKTVIAPVVKVTRWRSISSSARSASKRWSSTSGAPVSSESPMWAMRPVMWKSGATPRITSSAPTPTQSR